MNAGSLRLSSTSKMNVLFILYNKLGLYKYDQEVYDVLMESFDLFPLSCVINGKFVALHGGISPDLRSLEDIKRVDRYKEPPKQGLFCDLLWSDPVENDGGYSD